MRFDRRRYKQFASYAFLLACLAAMYLTLRPMFLMTRDSAMLDSCFSRLGSLGKATGLYLADHDERYPLAKSWMDALGSAAQKGTSRKSLFRCPEVARNGNDGQFGYAFNKRLSCVPESGIEDSSNTPVIFDSSDLAYNASGTFDLLPNPPRHMGNVVLWADLGTRRHRRKDH